MVMEKRTIKMIVFIALAIFLVKSESGKDLVPRCPTVQSMGFASVWIPAQAVPFLRHVSMDFSASVPSVK